MTALNRDVATPLKVSGIDEPEWTLTQKGADGELAAATGLTVTVFYSLTSAFSTAVAIDASLSLTCTERAGKPGTYFCQMPEAAKVAHLADKAGQVIYEVMAVDGVAQDYQARRVVDQ